MTTHNVRQTTINIETLKIILWHTLQAQDDTHLPTAPQAKQILERSAQNGLPIQYLFRAPLFDEHKVFAGTNQRDWVFMPLSKDPLFSHKAGFPIPNGVLRQLKAMRDAGIEFDDLYIAHEVAKNSVSEGQHLTSEAFLPEPSAQTSALSQNFGEISRFLWTIAILPLTVLGNIALSILTALANADYVSGSSSEYATSSRNTRGVAHDPILFGVLVEPSPSDMTTKNVASWFYLAHWDYSETI